MSDISAEDLRYPAMMSVWAHWFVLMVCMFLAVYRPQLDLSKYIGFAVCFGVLISANGIMHYRMLSHRAVTWRWMLGMGAIDLILIAAAMVSAGGYNHYFFYLLYIPALALFAVVFGSFKLNMAWTTLAASSYVLVSLTLGETLNFAATEEKALVGRITVMYLMAATVNLVSNHQRMRMRRASERERVLEREQIELSRTMHDNTAQSLYMLRLGIETAVDIAGTPDRALRRKLDATRELAKSALWDLRHPIDMGLIYEGRELGRVLSAHADTFTTITSVPAQFKQTGTEPDLSTAVRNMLFSITHNALTNSFRHAQATEVTIALDYTETGIRLSVTDDGIGLPDDYDDRGHGFRNMRANAQRAGGQLEIGVPPSGKGTVINCVIDFETDQ